MYINDDQKNANNDYKKYFPVFINANLKKMNLAKMQKINQACIISHKTTRK